MSNKCPNCGIYWDKALKDNYNVILPKDCPGCRIRSSRQSLRSAKPIRKQKQQR